MMASPIDLDGVPDLTPRQLAAHERAVADLLARAETAIERRPAAPRAKRAPKPPGAKPGPGRFGHAIEVPSGTFAQLAAEYNAEQAERADDLRNWDNLSAAERAHKRLLARDADLDRGTVDGLGITVHGLRPRSQDIPNHDPEPGPLPKPKGAAVDPDTIAPASVSDGHYSVVAAVEGIKRSAEYLRWWNALSDAEKQRRAKKDFDAIVAKKAATKASHATAVDKGMAPGGYEVEHHQVVGHNLPNEKAAAWLENVFYEFGWSDLPAAAVRRAGVRYGGFTRSTLESARIQLGIVTTKVGAAWWWTWTRDAG